MFSSSTKHWSSTLSHAWTLVSVALSAATGAIQQHTVPADGELRLCFHGTLPLLRCIWVLTLRSRGSLQGLRHWDGCCGAPSRSAAWEHAHHYSHIHQLSTKALLTGVYAVPSLDLEIGGAGNVVGYGIVGNVHNHMARVLQWFLSAHGLHREFTTSQPAV